MNELVRLIYALFIGGTIAVVTALTISVAHPGPAYPQADWHNAGPPSEQQMKDQEDKYKQYEKESVQHSKETAKLILAVSILIFALGLAAAKINRLYNAVSEGMLFGGFFTAVYSIAHGFPLLYFSGAERPQRWVSVAAAFVALAMIIIITQRNFAPVSPQKTINKNR